jgi:CO/xanthine dehydrogenase FAD-binding subunit
MNPDRLLAGGRRVLHLVETGIDSPVRVIDIMDIRPLGDLGVIAKLGPRVRSDSFKWIETKSDRARSSSFGT